MTGGSTAYVRASPNPEAPYDNESSKFSKVSMWWRGWWITRRLLLYLSGGDVRVSALAWTHICPNPRAACLLVKLKRAWWNLCISLTCLQVVRTTPSISMSAMYAAVRRKTIQRKRP